MNNIVTKNTINTDELGISDYSWVELMDTREKFLQEKENIESALDALGEEMMFRLEEENINGKIVGEKTISKVITYTTDKETAKELGAISIFTTERINTGMIKDLYNQGIEIKNLVITKRPLIRDIKKKED